MFKILNRPLSPHLTIYTSQLTSLYSIWHRLTGVFLIVILVTFLLLCKISSYIVFNFSFINIILETNEWFRNCVFLNFILIFSYHLLNGLRHISWDLGFNLPINIVINSAKINAIILFTIIVSILKSIIN